MDTKNKVRSNAVIHLFAVGQNVQLKGKGTFSKTEIYQIKGILPPRGHSPQYRIQNHYENYQRVITQDQIESASSLPVNIETTFVEQTFSKISIPARHKNANGLGGLL